MRHALEYACHGDGLRVPHNLHFFFDTTKSYLSDIGSNQGELGSGQSASEAGNSAVSSSAAPITASDQALVVGSGNTSITNNVLDPNAIAAGVAIAQSGLDAAQEAFQGANSTIEDAIAENTAMSKQTQAGPLATDLKPIGFIALGLFGIWAVYKIVVGVFGGRKAATS